MEWLDQLGNENKYFNHHSPGIILDGFSVVWECIWGRKLFENWGFS